MKRLKNDGMTLIEVIVVVAILGVVMALIPMSLSTVFSTEARRCTNDLGTLLASCRVNCMSRSGDVYVRVVREDDGVYGEYYENDVLMERDKIGNNSVTLSATDSAGQTVNAQFYDLIFSFDRSTGEPLTIGDANKLFDEAASDDPFVYASIRISSVNRTYVITIEPVTGNHEQERVE